MVSNLCKDWNGTVHGDFPNISSKGEILVEECLAVRYAYITIGKNCSLFQYNKVAIEEENG